MYAEIITWIGLIPKKCYHTCQTIITPAVIKLWSYHENYRKLHSTVNYPFADQYEAKNKSTLKLQIFRKAAKIMTCERSNRVHQKFRLMRRKVKAPAMNRLENFF